MLDCVLCQVHSQAEETVQHEGRDTLYSVCVLCGIYEDEETDKQ